MRQAKAMGLLQKFLAPYLRQGIAPNKDGMNGGGRQKAISVNVLAPVLLIVAAGWLLALVAFALLELMMPALAKRRRRRRSRRNYDVNIF